MKTNPTPQVSPEVEAGITLEYTNIAHELDALIARRNCFAGVSCPAIAAVSSGLKLQPGLNTLMVVTGVQVNKATAGFVSVQFDDQNAAPFVGTFAASFAFFRDTRWGNSQTTRTAAIATTHLTGGFPGGTVIKRAQVLANTWTQIPIQPGLVLVRPTPGLAGGAQFGVFNETLNEALDVMIDFYERAASPGELALPGT